MSLTFMMYTSTFPRLNVIEILERRSVIEFIQLFYRTGLFSRYLSFLRYFSDNEPVKFAGWSRLDQIMSSLDTFKDCQIDRHLRNLQSFQHPN